jgi:hypothetical protein
MVARHLRVIGLSRTDEPRLAQIHEAFTTIWGSNPGSLEAQHRDALIALGVTPEAARPEFSLRKIR